MIRSDGVGGVGQDASRTVFRSLHLLGRTIIATRVIERLESAYSSLRLIHLPIHASWLNQVEIYFSIVQRKVLTRNDFADLAAVARRLLTSKQAMCSWRCPSNGSSPGPTCAGSSPGSSPRRGQSCGVSNRNTCSNFRSRALSHELGHGVLVGVGPAPHGEGGGLDGIVVLADRAMLPVVVAMLML